jgi:hypothetical protein
VQALNDGRIQPLAPTGQVSEDELRSCRHIVALMGHQPILSALDNGAALVLAGRATDTAMVAAVAAMRGLPDGPTWHAAKTVECAGTCTTRPRAANGLSCPVFVEIDPAGFTVMPLHPDSACTPTSVAGHMLHENADPFRLIEPTGTLDTSQSTYTAVTDRAVRVEGSRFEPAPQPTAKLEGSRLAGYETISIVGIADPTVIADIGGWVGHLTGLFHERVAGLYGLTTDQYECSVRLYGRDAVLGPLTASSGAPSEIGVLLRVRAESQELATALAKTANPLLLHLPPAGADHMPSFAFPMSPPEVERGAVYEFALNHVVAISGQNELFRTVVEDY